MGPQWIIAATTVTMLLSATAIIVLSQSGAGLWGVLVPLSIFITACGFTFPTIQVLALAHHGSEAGTAASVLGALNFGLAGVISPVVGMLGVSTAAPMGLVMLITSSVSILVLWLLVRPRTVPELGN